MPDKDHAFWDTPRGLPARNGRGSAIPAENARTRAGVFEDAARNPAAANLPDLTEYARHRIPRLRRDHPRSLWRFSRMQGAFALYAFLSIIALLTLGLIMFLHPSGRLAPLGMLIAALTQGFIIAGILYRPHLRRAASGHCTDCNYNLAGCPRPPGLTPQHLDNLDLGPARCPECGAFWPLVPPAA